MQMYKHTKEIYETEEAKKYFPNGMPNLFDRSTFWDNCWDDWRANEVLFKERIPQEYLNKIGRFNYMRRGEYYRFRNREDSMFLKITYKTGPCVSKWKRD